MIFDLFNPDSAFIVNSLYLLVDTLTAWMLYKIASKRKQQVATVKPALVALM